jgi:secondary thiamine-phosphate synthase enzyme
VLHQSIHELLIATTGRGFYDVTADIAALIRKSRIQTGLATLHLQHTSASLLIQENADPDVRRDLEKVFARLAPDADPAYHHAAEGDDDMAAHVRTVLTAVNLSIPIIAGALALGTWQAVYLWEHRTHPHTRQIVVHLLGEP